MTGTAYLCELFFCQILNGVEHKFVGIDIVRVERKESILIDRFVHLLAFLGFEGQLPNSSRYPSGVSIDESWQAQDQTSEWLGQP
jgi:hypothetical protein